MDMHPLRIGAIPAPTRLIPSTLERLYTMGLIASLGTIAGSVAFDMGNLPALGAGLAAACLVPLFGRVDTSETRGGYVGDRPTILAPLETSAVNSLVHPEATELLRRKTGNDSLTVHQSRGEQFNILTVRNLDPKPLESAIDSLAMLLGVDIEEILFIPVFAKETSAYLVPLPATQWQAIPYHNQHLEHGQLISYLGQSIKGEPITVNRRINPHGIFAGTTGSGKTESMRVDIQCMKDSGLNPAIYIIDQKEELNGIPCEEYTNDPKLAIQMIQRLGALAAQRKTKYTQAGCKNYFEYQAKVDSSERPLMLYIDELAVLLKGEKEEANKAQALLSMVARLNRAGGLFLTIGIQRPDAKILDGEFKSNFGFICALAHSDKVSSRVSIESGIAASLPMLGGIAVKVVGSRKLAIGRAPYLGDLVTV